MPRSSCPYEKCVFLLVLYVAMAEHVILASDSSCAAGSFAQLDGSCEPCAAGRFAATTGQVLREECLSGTVCGQTAVVCEQCPVDTFEENRLSCEPCPPNTSALVGSW